MRIRILLGLFTSLAVASAAAAAPQTDPLTGALSVAVSSGGMDLTRAENAKVMLARLTHAASSVCGGQPRPMELQRADDYRACMHEALDAAVTELGAPVVADLYRNQGASVLAESGAAR